jgi:hypothetical protein
MDEYESLLSHSKWNYKYHVVFIQVPRENNLCTIAATFDGDGGLLADAGSDYLTLRGNDPAHLII